MKLVTHCGVKNAKTILEQVQEAVNNWAKIARESGVSKGYRLSIKKFWRTSDKKEIDFVATPSFNEGLAYEIINHTL